MAVKIPAVVITAKDATARAFGSVNKGLKKIGRFASFLIFIPKYISVAIPTRILIISGSAFHIDSQKPPIPAAVTFTVSITLPPYLS